MRDNKTLCRPSEGHPQEIEIDLTLYIKVAELSGELKSNDLMHPFGQPDQNFVKVGNSLYELQRHP
jgi:hypothetical protein